MLTLEMTTGEKKSFSLKTQDREKSMRDAWYAMHGDPKYAQRRFKVTTADGDLLDIAVDDIKMVDLTDAEYFKVGPENVGSSSNPLPEPIGGNGMRDKAHENRERRAEIFVKRILERGVRPNLLDPFFIVMIKKAIEEDIPESKIVMYANIYANRANQRT